MSDVKCGKVTEADRDEIKRLHQRRVALKEMLGPLAKLEAGDMAVLYEKLVADIGVTTTEFHGWWDRKAKQYGWEVVAGAHWSIDFDTCEVVLRIPG